MEPKLSITFEGGTASFNRVQTETRQETSRLWMLCAAATLVPTGIALGTHKWALLGGSGVMAIGTAYAYYRRHYAVEEETSQLLRRLPQAGEEIQWIGGGYGLYHNPPIQWRRGDYQHRDLPYIRHLAAIAQAANFERLVVYAKSANCSTMLFSQDGLFGATPGANDNIIPHIDSSLYVYIVTHDNHGYSPTDDAVRSSFHRALAHIQQSKYVPDGVPDDHLIVMTDREQQEARERGLFPGRFIDRLGLAPEE